MYKKLFLVLVPVLFATVSITSAAWVNATGSLTGTPTECGDLQSIYSVPNTNMTITGVAANGIYSTTNGGTIWTKMSGSVATMRMMQMIFDPDHPNTWYAGGIYHTPGIVKTNDAGVTWAGLGNLGTNDGFAVDFSDPQRKTLLAGGHEAQSTLWKSTDGGSTWTNIGCPGGGYSSFPYIINTQTYLMGIQSAGIYRSTDAGSSWTKVSSTAPTTHITKTAAGDLYYAGGGKVIRGSSDGTSWTVLTSSFNAAGAAPVELPGGKIAVVNSNGIAISADKGATWKTGCQSLPTQITSFWAFNAGIGLTYNSVAGAFYTFYWNCVFSNAAIGTDQIWRFDTVITSGTGVIQTQSKPHYLSAGSESRYFDIAGHSIQPGLPLNRSFVYILRNRDGTVVRRFVTKN